jgi:hypothetical protein
MSALKSAPPPESVPRSVGPNMFYTVTLPCTLWFLDKGNAKTPRADTVREVMVARCCVSRIATGRHR